MLTYAVFYRNCGIRLQQHLIRPPMTPISKLFLPMNSIYHFIDHDPEILGPTKDETVLSLVHGPVVVDHVTSYVAGADAGKPRTMPMNTMSLITNYHLQQRAFKRYTGVNMLKPPGQLLVVNYELIDRHYRYIETYLTPYQRWYNLYKTIFAKAAELAKTSERQQFIQMHLPAQVPPLSLFKRSGEFNNRMIAERINTDTLRLICDFWRWVGTERNDTILSEYDNDILSKINIIWIQGGLWTTLNLGVLDSWRKSNKEDSKGPGFAKIDPELLQRRVLRLFISISEAVTVAADKPEEAEAQAEEVDRDRLRLDEDDVTKEPVRISDYDTSLSEPPDSEAVGAKVVKPKGLADLVRQGGVDVAESKNDEEIEEDIPDVSDDEIDKDLERLEKLDNEVTAAAEAGYKPYEPIADNLESGVIESANKLARKGLLSAAELRRFERLSRKYKEIKNPFGGEGTLEDLTKIKPEEVAIAETTPIAEDIPGVIDKTMLSSSITHFDAKYVKTVLPKDVTSMVLNLQKAGIAVTDYQVHRTEDYNDHYEIHSVKVVPVVGKPTTLRFQVPVIARDGSFKASGVRYKMRRQRGDVPIRKTAPDTVTLTSYYSKMFVKRSERAVFNYAQWLQEQIVAVGVDPSTTGVTDISLRDVFYNDVKLPRVYTTIARRIAAFTSTPYQFNFDYAKRNEFFGEHVVTVIEKSAKLKGVPIAKGNDSVLIMDYNNVIWKVNVVKEGVPPEQMGFIEELLGLPLEKRPVDVAEVNMFGKDLPLGFVLAQHIGLGNLLATLKPNYRRVKTGSSYGLEADEFIVRFEDEALIFKRSNYVHSMIFAGFNRYHREIKYYSVYSFDKPEVYANVFEDNALGARYVREIDLMFKLWVDHITKELLVEMQEPTDLFNLFLSAVEKLTLDEHPEEMDVAYQRDKGYERIAGMMYFEMVKAMRGYVSKPANANASVDLNPRAVWMNILQDQTVMPTEESNPIHSLKEKEVVVFGGSGGRTGRSMTAKHRTFHPNGLGVVSEATVDSGDVATITYLTADPNYTSLRGTTRRIKNPEKNITKMLSTSMLLAAASDRDDPKRVNFISVQNSQTTFSKGNKPMPVRTGYERVLAHRTDDLFAKTAEEEGVVEELSDKAVTIRYKSGEAISYEIGRKFGKWSGHVMPHDIATKLKQGQKVKKGDVIVYNTHYFTPDTLDPKQVVPRSGILARVVCWETPDTLDDASAISQRLGNELTTLDTHVRNIKVTFDQEIRNLIKVGEKVEHDSILCTIHTESGGNADIFDDDALSTLSAISSNAPRAKMKGVVERIEVLYTGEPEEMSGSLRTITDKANSELRKLQKQLGRKGIEGKVEVGYRVDGQPLDVDTAVVRVYITGDVPMGVGDKCVFAHQMKSVVGRVMAGINQTEDGLDIDAYFGYYGLQKRIVLSADLIGTLNTILRKVGEKAVAAYRGK